MSSTVESAQIHVTKRRRLDNENHYSKIPTVNNASFWNSYDTYKAVHLPRVQTSNQNALKWTDLQQLFKSLNNKDQASWCLETGTNENKNISPGEFLHPTTQLQDGAGGYCSFLVQHDKETLDKTLDRLPFKSLPDNINNVTYSSCLWFFVGRNSSQTNLEGRPEHTDSVSHDGTWHYQLSGTKIWYLRPTTELLQKSVDMEPSAVYKVVCQEGDVLVVNTRLWWHCTEIPSNTDVSVSYARDFFISRDEQSCSMTNVDGLYAANDVEEGTIIFKETDMPNCELHTSRTNPNVKVVELQDGTSAVVSSRNIAAGEFFCVAEESSWEEQEQEEEEEQEQEEEEQELEEEEEEEELFEEEEDAEE